MQWLCDWAPRKGACNGCANKGAKGRCVQWLCKQGRQGKVRARSCATGRVLLVDADALRPVLCRKNKQNGGQYRRFTAARKIILDRCRLMRRPHVLPGAFKHVRLHNKLTPRFFFEA